MLSARGSRRSGRAPQRRSRLATLLAAGAAWIATAAGAALAAEQTLLYPLSVVVDRSGTAYVADRKLPGVWKIESGKAGVFYRESVKFRTPLNAIRCVAIDADGKLLAGDSATREIYRFDEKGLPQPLTGNGKLQGGVGIPMSIVNDADGNLLVSDLETQRILKVPKAGGAAEPVASIHAPRGLFYDAKKQLWVISGRRLVRLSPKGDAATIVDDGVFSFPHTVVVADDGTAYVCDGYAKAVWRIAPGGKPEKWVQGPPLDNPVGLALFKGTLWLADPRAVAVFEIDAKGALTRHNLSPAK